MVNLAALNRAVLRAWGQPVQVTVGTQTFNTRAVYNAPYVKSPVGNTAIERPDPTFAFKISDYQQTGAGVNDTITASGIKYTITSRPSYEPDDWCTVDVSAYT